MRLSALETGTIIFVLALQLNTDITSLLWLHTMQQMIRLVLSFLNKCFLIIFYVLLAKDAAEHCSLLCWSKIQLKTWIPVNVCEESAQQPANHTNDNSAAVHEILHE